MRLCGGRTYEAQAALVEGFHNIPHHSLDFGSALHRLDKVGCNLIRTGRIAVHAAIWCMEFSFLRCARFEQLALTNRYTNTKRPGAVRLGKYLSAHPLGARCARQIQHEDRLRRRLA